MVTIIIIMAILFLLYLLSVMGRRNHPGLAKLRGWSYAHRGLHDEKRPGPPWRTATASNWTSTCLPTAIWQSCTMPR